LPFLIGLIVEWSESSETDSKSASSATAVTPGPAPSVSAAPDPARPRWTSESDFPIGVDSDGDGVEDVLGATTRLEGPNKTAFVSLFDGKTFAERYHVGPFTSLKGIIVAAAGARFVVRDPKGDVHLYELTDGKLVADFTFPNGAGGLCGPPGHESVVAVDVSTQSTAPIFKKGGTFLIDTVTGVGKLGPAPAWCYPPEGWRRRVSESYNGYQHHQGLVLGEDKLELPPRTAIAFAWGDGNDVIAAGRVMGSEEWQLLGFDGHGKLRYQTPVPGLTAYSKCDLAFGLAVCEVTTTVTIATGGDPHALSTYEELVALDTASGALRWRVRPPNNNWISWLSLTPTRVWAPKHGDDNYLLAYDAHTGTLLGTVGQ